MKMKKNTVRLLNIAFVLTGLGIVIFLWRAPEETTTRLPHDEKHEVFHQIKSKKDAEKKCVGCHEENGEFPLSEEHPPKFRCLFCHKR